MKIYLLPIFCFLTITIFGQDFHFSGNEQLPMYLNPAMTGFLKNTQGRAMVKYRNQWASILEKDAFQTYATSVEWRICDGNFWGFGGFLMHDQSGQPSFETTQGLLSVSYHQRISGQTYLAGGVNTGFINYEVDDRLAFPEQFDGNIGFDFGLPSFENIDQFEANLIDIGAGLLLYSDDNYQWFFGLALQHINNSTSYQFKEDNSLDAINLRMRKTVHGGIAKKIKESHSIAFKGSLQWQEPHWQSIVGLYVKLTSFNIGIATRFARNQPNSILPPVTDAAILSFSYEMAKMKFGFSYDVNVSALYRSTSYKGAMEFTASYFFGERSKCLNCPQF